MKNSKKYIISQIAAIFAILMMLFGPLISSAIATDASEVICTSSGVKVISLNDASGEHNNSLELLEMCGYCKLSFKEFYVVNLDRSEKVENFFFRASISNSKDLLSKNLALLSFKRQAPPIKL